MDNRVKEVLAGIIDRFKAGDMPKAIAYSVFPIPAIPSAKWSLLNRLLMTIAGTRDARGFRQWQQEGRYVVKGAKAFYILVPYLKKVEEEGGEKEVLRGFMAKPVFRYEDTDGKQLDYPELELPELPLAEVARQWGIEVKAIPGNYSLYGYYSAARKEIALATKDECVFFHELAHCAHEKVQGSLKAGQDALQEIVAELASQALCRIVGKKPDDTLGNSYQYIESYATKLGVNAYTACLKVMSETEKVLNLILKGTPEPTTEESLEAKAA
jgi:hypothetical protein